MTAPLELDRDARALLNSIHMWRGDRRPLLPCENRVGLRLEAMGVVRLTCRLVTVGEFSIPMSEAVITDAGRRALKGPQAVAVR